MGSSGKPQNCLETGPCAEGRGLARLGGKRFGPSCPKEIRKDGAAGGEMTIYKQSWGCGAGS